MRILLLPLTRRQTLLYAQRLTQNEGHKPNPWLIWASQKAQQTWLEWGKSDTKWKARTVETGNKLLDKIDWEEYSLKTVHDPKSTKTENVCPPVTSLERTFFRLLGACARGGLIEDGVDGRFRW